MLKYLAAAGLLWAAMTGVALPQADDDAESASPPTGALHTLTSAAMLPTDRTTESALEPAASVDIPSDVARWLRPQWGVMAEWEPETDGIEVLNFDADVTVPTFPIWGPPPPLISAGFSFTDLMAPADLDLPPALYDFTLGASWMRRIRDQWMLRIMLGAAFATDLNHTSGDAWQLRGGLFAIYDCRPDLQFLVGAVATGRADIPVLPGLGVLWRPTPTCHVNLLMPRPRVSFLVLDRGDRQHWMFIGAGLSGGTWACETKGIDDKITYREWRRDRLGRGTAQDVSAVTGGRRPV